MTNSTAGLGAHWPQLVSVVIPCFNAQAYLAATIDSVLHQTWRDLEVVVVDDCSTDDSAAVVSAFAQRDPRVSLIRMPHNHGAPAAPRNAGVAAARGTWVAFLDADDVWHPRKLELQMQALREQGATMCSTQMKDFRDDSEIDFTPPGAPRVERIDFGMQLRKYRTPTSSIVVRRDLMLAQRFNEDPSYKAREDTDLFICVHEHMPYSVKLMHPLVFYRLQASQISGNKLKMVRRHLSMLQKYRRRSGASLGAMAYVYTCTHFVASVYLRLMRGRL